MPRPGDGVFNEDDPKPEVRIDKLALDPPDLSQCSDLWLEHMAFAWRHHGTPSIRLAIAADLELDRRRKR